MQALFLENGRLQYTTDYPKPNPQADEALISITLAGICSTDLEIVKGYVPNFRGILGHEFVGVVEACADDQWVGQRVVGSINIGCQQCADCAKDNIAHCPNRQAVGIHNHDGAFADYLVLPTTNLHIVPDTVTDETAVFTEPLAAALRIREQVEVKPNDKTAVVGPGRLGLLIAQVLAQAGGDVTVLGRRPESLALPAKWGLNTGVANNFADNSFDFIVEATGNEAGMATSLRLLRPRGTLILKSTFHSQANIDLTKIVVSEINLVGSRCGPFAPALRLFAQNQIDTQSLISATFPLQNSQSAFKQAAQSGVHKILLQP